jgi:small subunit ribosomal protein S7
MSEKEIDESGEKSEETDVEIKLFGKWSFKDIVVNDPGLRTYINLKPIYIPNTFGRHEKVKFGKANVPVVERLINRLLSPGREKGTKKIGKEGGKKLKAMKIVEQAFGLIEKRTGENPIQVLVRAIENSAPREETIEIRQGGVVRRYSVDISPQRRLDLALKFIVSGARQRAWRSPLTISECLAEELILASRGRFESYAVKKRVEIERIAEASR